MDLNKLTGEQRLELEELLAEKEYREVYEKVSGAFPEHGKYKRDLYPKHVRFFTAGAAYKQRAAIAANQTGKSYMCAYEVSLHLTGEYPKWWNGLRYDRPVDIWCAGFKANVKEAIQEYLVGSPNDPGTGFVPKERITRITRKAGVTDVFQDIYVKHRTGGLSRCTLKTYDEKTSAFQGARLDFIWLDEEPVDANLYGECLTRLVAKEGSMICSFTPLRGLSDTVMSFLDEGRLPEGGSGAVNGKYITNITWDDVPHLSADMKEELMSTFLPHQRDARSKGIPALGSGAIFPVPESEITVKPFDIPSNWPRAYGFDVGFAAGSAAIWGAYDESSDTWYLYSEHFRKQVEPSVHADAIKARGKWINGVIDPGSRCGSQKAGEKLFQIYIDLDLCIAPANNAVEPGLQEVWQRLSSGRLKVFSTCRNWFSEFRVYRRDEKGKIVKKNDHLMDATRYLVVSGLEVAVTYEDDDDIYQETPIYDNRSSVTGY